MVGRVKGVRHTSGEYEGNAYDNVYLHCLVAPDTATLCGELTEIFKVRYITFDAVCKRLGVSVRDLLDASIRVFYDKYGRIEDFDILE